MRRKDLAASPTVWASSSFALLRLPSSGDVTFAYAANNPDRVSHLVIWEGHQVQDDIDSPRKEQLQAIEPVMERDWELYMSIRARIIAGWDGSNAPIVEAILRETHSAESPRAMNEVLMDTDPAPYLRRSRRRRSSCIAAASEPGKTTPASLPLASPTRTLQVVREHSIGPFPNESAVNEMLDFISPDSGLLGEYAHDRRA